jgi:hypothetical protein
LCILDCSIEKFGGEVICGYIATYRNGITAGSLDFVDYGLCLLCIEATFVSTMYGAHQHHSFTCKRGTGRKRLLGHNDLCAFLGKEESRTSTDSLYEQAGKQATFFKIWA